MYLWIHVNDHKVQDMGVRKCIYLYHFIFNQYHTKIAFSGFLLQKLAWLKCDLKLLQQLKKNNFITTTECCRIMKYMNE